MSFPAFDGGKPKVLFFSRGRGRGHAIPDIEIIRALASIAPEAAVRIVSYGLGAATFASLGFSLIDLDLPDTSPIAEMSVIAGKLIGLLRPDIVVSHEEFAAIPAAKIFDKPTPFLTDWFGDFDSYAMNALQFADKILFLGEPGIFQEPPWLKDRVSYVGTVLRQFAYGRGDRLRARSELGIAGEALVLSVFPGSWPESPCPVIDLILGALRSSAP